MRAHYLQHVPFEGLQFIEQWLDARGFETGCTRLFAGEAIPAIDAVDLLIVLGGPMSVNDESIYPWLAPEKQYISKAIAMGTPTLGICLGAQLIAAAAGARVFPNRRKEIGWFPLSGLGGGAPELFEFPGRFTAFHWHGETFDLPRGAIRLARSAACENQAFQLGRRAIALQFHLEAGPEGVSAMIENCRGDMGTGEFVQPERDMIADSMHRSPEANSEMARVLDYLVARRD